MAAIKLLESGASAADSNRLSLALLICAIGIAGLLRDSWPGTQRLPNLNLHAVFGTLLWIMVVAQFRYASLAGSPLSAAGVHELCRRISRRVYLLLYILFGASQIVRIAAILWNSGAQGAAHAAILPLPENLRDYLAYGVFALCTIQVLAACSARRSNTALRAIPSAAAHHQHDK